MIDNPQCSKAKNDIMRMLLVLSLGASQWSYRHTTLAFKPCCTWSQTGDRSTIGVAESELLKKIFMERDTAMLLNRSGIRLLHP